MLQGSHSRPEASNIFLESESRRKPSKCVPPRNNSQTRFSRHDNSNTPRSVPLIRDIDIVSSESSPCVTPRPMMQPRSHARNVTNRSYNVQSVFQLFSNIPSRIRYSSYHKKKREITRARTVPKNSLSFSFRATFAQCSGPRSEISDYIEHTGFTTNGDITDQFHVGRIETLPVECTTRIRMGSSGSRGSRAIQVAPRNEFRMCLLPCVDRCETKKCYDPFVDSLEQ